NVFAGLLASLFSPSRATALETGQGRVTYWMLVKSFAAALVPFVLVAGTLWLVWWYVVIHQQAGPQEVYSGLQQLGTPELGQSAATPAEQGPPQGFYLWFGIIAGVCALLQVRYYWRLDADRLEVIKLLSSSIMPL